MLSAWCIWYSTYGVLLHEEDMCRLDALMAEERAAFDASCAVYEAKKAELMQRVLQQQASVRQIVECARVPSPEADSRYIPSTPCPFVV